MSEAKGEQRIRFPTRSGETNSPFPDHIHGYNRPIFDDPARNKYLTFIDHFTVMLRLSPSLTKLQKNVPEGMQPKLSLHMAQGPH